MGEVSKNSGELGEKYVSNFLNLIGWTNHQEGLSIECIEPEKHNTNNSKNGRKTHGIDKLYTYISPMDTSTLIHSIVSVKHTQDEYPSSPNSKFKEFMQDLAYTIECYPESELIIQNRSNYNVEDEKIIGLLFWISSKSDRNYSIINNLQNPRLNDDLLYDRIQIIDNDRMEYISKSIDLIKIKYKNYKYSFYYFETPNNIADKEKQSSGKVLPIEMLNSDIQIYKLEKDKEIILVLVLKDNFHKDILKRIFGLAHRLSNNLTSNIHIYFKNFEHEVQENKNIVNNIKQQFKDKSFIEHTFVFGYDIGFKNTQVQSETTLEIPNEKLEKPPYDNGSLLPYGEHLRALLSSSLISASELNTLLKKKGIYICNPTKENTIPVLSSLILTPNEFEILKEHQKNKEDKEKRQDTKIKTLNKQNAQDLKKHLKSFNLNKIDTNKFRNYEYKTPNINFALDKDKQILTAEYEIKRKQGNKSWHEQIDIFKGQVIIDCSKDELEIITKSISTAKETLYINRLIINHVKEQLKKAKVISETTKEEKILMNDMTNEEILQFLLAFTNNSKLKNIEFNDIISIDIEIDETVTLPNDSQIKWMEEKIKKLKLDGKKIEDIEILSKNENHKYLKCWGIVASFNFNNSIAGKGNVKIDFRFNPHNKNEFFIQINKIYYDKKIYLYRNIEEMVLTDIDNIKFTKHKEIMEKKNV